MSNKENWEEAWVFIHTHKNEFRTWARLGQSYLCSLGMDPANAEDLVHSFALEQLPTILRRIRDPSFRGADLAYIRGSFRNYVRMSARRANLQNRAFDQLESLANSQPPDDPPIEIRYLKSPVLGKGLDPVFDQLDTAEVAALRSYLGPDEQKPRSIRQVAEALDVSRYRARALIVDGFLSAAAYLGERGALTELDLRVCKLVLADGLSTEEAAKQLNVPVKTIAGALQRARDHISQFIH